MADVCSAARLRRSLPGGLTRSPRRIQGNLNPLARLVSGL